ncbi:MAG: ATP-binding cassette domain-containing protein [Thermoanaerobaculia bacterium]|nr:ATP-binding cassette domain-containing protein [Thermoanaerobaculia bacterium]
MSDPIYRLVEVRKSYGDKVVLDGLDLELPRGKSLVIMGRSGSGKSVTLRLMDGLDKPDSGQIFFDGEDIAPLRERELYSMRHRVAMLFQSGALFDSMNVYDNLAFQLRRHTDAGPEEIRQRVDRALEMVELEDVDEKMPSALSGGMRKRVALARSLIINPEVVLFDEPTTGLDPLTSATIAKLIRNIQRRLEMSSVVVTHEIPLARRVGDLVAFLEDGEAAFVGTWEEADARPEGPFGRFLAANEVSDAA